MRGRVLFIVAVVGFVAIVPLIYYLLFEYGLSVSTPQSPIPRPPKKLHIEAAKEEQVVPVALSLTQLQGHVEIMRSGDKWRPAEEGMVLAADDRIRTDPSARAMLSMPGMFTVELDSGSDFQVKKLAENISRFMLEEGMISADVVENSENTFEVAASSALARTSGASFKMAVNSEGLVAVGTAKGSVDLSAAAKVVRVREGYLARVVRGKAPEDPIRIPRELFLKVRWPKTHDLASRSLAVGGQTDRGARIRVDGVMVAVDTQGRFFRVLALKEGVNRIKVESYDVGGNNVVDLSPSLNVDTRPDSFQIQTSPNMWEKKKKMEHPEQVPNNP